MRICVSVASQMLYPARACVSAARSSERTPLPRLPPGTPSSGSRKSSSSSRSSTTAADCIAFDITRLLWWLTARSAVARVRAFSYSTSAFRRASTNSHSVRSSDGIASRMAATRTKSVSGCGVSMKKAHATWAPIAAKYAAMSGHTRPSTTGDAEWNASPNETEVATTHATGTLSALSQSTWRLSTRWRLQHAPKHVACHSVRRRQYEGNTPAAVDSATSAHHCAARTTSATAISLSSGGSGVSSPKMSVWPGASSIVAHSATRSDARSRSRMLTSRGVSPGRTGGDSPQRTVLRTRRRVSGTSAAKSAGEGTMPSRDCVRERSMRASGAREGARDAHMLRTAQSVRREGSDLPPSRSRREVRSGLCRASPQTPRTKTLVGRRCRLTEGT